MVDLQTLQEALTRLLTDPAFQEAALRGGSDTLPPALRSLDAARVEALARSLAEKRVQTLRRALPVSMDVLGEAAGDLLARFTAACPPRVGLPGTDAERFAAFAPGAEEVARTPGWLADLLRYEAARHAVRRAPIPTRRGSAPAPVAAEARLAPGPALRILALDWDSPALLPALRRGAAPQSAPSPTFLLLARTPDRGDLRERKITHATWDLLRRCDGTSPAADAITDAARAVAVPAPELSAFTRECLQTLATLAAAGLLQG